MTNESYTDLSAVEHRGTGENLTAVAIEFNRYRDKSHIQSGRHNRDETEMPPCPERVGRLAAATEGLHPVADPIPFEDAVDAMLDDPNDLPDNAQTRDAITDNVQ